MLTALNLTTLAASGPLPADHIPKKRTYKVSELAPFATNVQFQRASFFFCVPPNSILTHTSHVVLECTSLPGPQIRIIVNDGVVPLTGIEGCGAQKDGMCAVETFVGAMRKIIAGTDWEWDCHGDWEIPEGWETVTGEPPRRRG